MNLFGGRMDRRYSLVVNVAIIFAVIFFFSDVIIGADSINLEEELRITYQQKVALDKLRQRVSSLLPEPWMKQDLYLIRWLRATKFDIDEAQKRILATLKWRKQNKINNVLSEDFSDLYDDYPYNFSVDKQGQPVFIGFAGEWDIRSASITGRAPRIFRYMIKAMEGAQRMVWKMQLQGQNVTRLNLMIDLDGFNIPQHGCVQCLFRILEFLLLYDANYPGFADRVVFINTPPTVAVALDMIQANANGETLKAIKVYGRDKNVWLKALLSFMDRNQLPIEFGGTRQRSSMPIELNISGKTKF